MTPVEMTTATAPMLDVARIRADFPALRSGIAFFDGPGGTQTPTPVIEAIAAALCAPLSNRGVDNDAQRNAEQIVVEARRAMADFTGTEPADVVFGRSATQLTFDVGRTLASTWRPGDRVVVTRLDHDANVRPWVLLAERVGAEIAWTDFDPQSAELDLEQIARLITPRTRLVAVTGASNLLGTRPDVPRIAELAHAAGALLWVDAVHLAAHALIDLPALGADFAVCSPYKFLGPHLGVLAARRGRLASLRPDKLLPSTDALPERFELGTLPYELLAGTTAAVDYLADLAGAEGSRRERLRTSYGALEEHERSLRRQLEAGLDALGTRRYSRARSRTSTVSFDLPGRDPQGVARQLTAAKINAPAGHFYAIETSRHLGLGDRGAVRVGLAPYTTTEEIDRLLAALRR